MRSFTTSAVILTLLMLLLVMAGGFVFLFQAEMRLRDQVRQAATDVQDMQASLAETEFRLSASEATREAAADAVATAEFNAVLLEGQLVDSQQDVESLTDQVEELSAELADVRDELDALEAETAVAPPEARILAPADDDTLSISDEVEIVVIASDAEGLASITVMVDDDELSTFSLSGDRLATRRATWDTPATEGEHTISVSARSVNGTTGEPAEIQVTVSDIEARNATIRAEVEAAVAGLRGLPLLEPIVPTLLSRDQLRDRVEQDFAQEDSPEATREDVLVLSAFDFMPRDYDLHGALVDVQSEGILGFYDPETAEFVVVSDGVLMDPSAQWTHAHEFVHALQDQHYDLDRLTDDSFDSEARAAIRALAEGEAELIQYLFLFEGDFFSQKDVDDILSAPEQNDSSYLEELPPILVDDLVFPYREGLEFVAELYREGGFQAIDRAWRNPPVSTEQILHPDRYAAGDAPQIVALAPLTTTLGAGWEQIDDNILGEFYLREYLDQQVAASLAERASTGWGGDRYSVYWNETTAELVMALRLVWDTPEDAAEFSEVYAFYASALFDTEGETQPDGSICWQAVETICFSETGGTSLVVRAPEPALAASVLDAIR